MQQVNDLTAREAGEIVEKSEAGLFRIYVGKLPPSVTAASGFAVAEAGGATAVFSERLPIVAFNRVIGLGVFEPATEAMVDEWMARYGSKGVTFGIAVSPVAQPAEIVDWLLARGFMQGAGMAKLIRDAEKPRAMETALRIERVTEANAAAYGRVAQVAFGMPEWMADVLAVGVTVPNTYHYLSYAGDEPVGTGSLVVNGGVGGLFNGATLPDFRRRGSQGAIVARRIADGLELGCRWFTTETAEDTPEAPSPSYRNMLRHGFHLVYVRPTYVYDKEKIDG